MKSMYGPTASYCKMTGNRGITAFAIIETSHIAMHVWDESSPALIQLDVYTCSSLDKNKVFEALDDFDPVKVEYKQFDREYAIKEETNGFKEIY